MVAGSLDTLEQGWLRVLEEARGPSVHVACSATFAMRWLVPHLQGFYRRHPDIRVRLSMTSAQEIRHQGADLVLVWDRLSYPERDRERAIRLTDIAFGPICAPGYAVTLDGDRLACSTRIAHEHISRAWETWQANSGLTATSEAEIRFPHTHLCIEAALSGLGLALVERRMVSEDLAAGRLVAPCGFVPFADGLAAIPARDHGPSAATRAFLAWIVDEFAVEAAGQR
ncbi:LysR substrate-binding domain-containing protein [Bosea sp. (in: a-proteobacteria)]|uniref:LysR substrate-binding domain-containing protein n=1 Tax=Bosea sp. (in: a-proteobacteria) TaxID=1871050 RepID=UPI003F71392D